jgi:glycosyltransferase involved in cell wall biosynthesis
MRILLTVHQFLPDFAYGTEVLTFTAAKELQRRGHQVEVLTAFPVHEHVDDDARVDSYVHDGIPVTRFRFSWEPMGSQTLPLEMEYDNHLAGECLRDLLRSKRFDLVHGFHMHRLSARLVEVCREEGIPVLYTATDYWLVCPVGRLLLPDGAACAGPDGKARNCVRHLVQIQGSPRAQRMVSHLPARLVALAVAAGEKAGWRKAATYAPVLRRPAFMRERMNGFARVFVTTAAMGEIFCKQGLEPGRVKVLPHAIDTRAIRRTPLAPGRDRLVVGFIGTLAQWKGPQVLVEAMDRLGAQAPVELRIYGEPAPGDPTVESLRESARRDPRIRLLGTFPNERIGDVLADIDVLAVPSTWRENLPLVVLSALAAGRPVLGSAVPGIEGVVKDGVNGRVVPAGDASALAAVLGSWARDRGELERLASSAEPVGTLTQYVDELEGSYGEILAAAPARSP